MKKKVYLTLQNGVVFQGYRFGADGDVLGELVFSTNMVGYIETLTAPSNIGKIIVQTFPLIGNYGIINADAESEKVWPTAFVVREVCEIPSNFRSEGDLDGYLSANGVVGVYGIDTRYLTKILREEGAMNAYITSSPLTKEQLDALSRHQAKDALSAVAVKESKTYECENAKGTLALLNLGTKRSLIQDIANQGYRVISMPTYATAEEILSVNPDGIVIGDGPEDVEGCQSVVAEIKKLLGKKPMLGIGFGHEVMALSFGGKVSKQKYGHRGGNQPVKDVQTGKVYITTQNHDYVVETIAQGEICFVNVNDNSCEGIVYEKVNALGVQFEPASCGVGHTENVVYDKFFKMVKENANA